MKKSFAAMAIIILSLAVQQAVALPVTIDSLVGDKDGFGLPGAPAVPANGTLWQTQLGGVFFNDYRGANDLANAPFTDIWSSQSALSYDHTYSLGGATAISAQLSVQFAGVADSGSIDINPARGPWDVYANGILLGQIPQSQDPNAYQQVETYTWDVPIALLTGSDAILLNINVPTVNDGYAINYSELTILADTGGAVPDGGSAMLLLGLGLSGVALIRRKLAV